MAGDREPGFTDADPTAGRNAESSRQEAAPAAGTAPQRGPATAREREQGVGTFREGVEARAGSTAEEHRALARRLYDLWNERKFDDMLRFAADDVEAVQVPFNATFRGVEGYRQFLTGWLEAFPDARVRITRVIADDESVVVEFTGVGTHTGALVGPAGSIAPTGRRTELALVDVIEMRAGRIQRARSYFDSATMFRQLGALPGEAGATGGRTAGTASSR
jgi:steroid delta-isomerase-like uncharacterized protein